MKAKLLLAMALALLPSGLWADDDAEPLPEHYRQLQGDWKLSSVETDGVRSPATEEQARTPLVIAGKQMTLGPIKITYTIDDSTDPKLMDVVIPANSDQSQTFEGIYAVQQDDLTVCLSFRDDIKVRPADFSTAPNSSKTVFRFARIK